MPNYKHIRWNSNLEGDEKFVLYAQLSHKNNKIIDLIYGQGVPFKLGTFVFLIVTRRSP